MLRAQPMRMAQSGYDWLARAARYAQRRSREVPPLLAGWAILRRYTRHYQRAMKLYARQHGAAARRPRVYDVGVAVAGSGTSPFDLTLTTDFQALVHDVAERAAAALNRSADCEFFPAVPGASPTDRTADVPAVVNGEVIAIKLKDPFAIEGLRELSDLILEQLERNVYRSYLVVDRVYVYRSPVCRQHPAASWLWHFDNHPREMLKVMLYLTDVTGETAPFEYLRDRATGRPQWGSPLAPLHGGSRVSAESIEQRLATGAERQAVTGPSGTVIVFDDNIIHRGTLARGSHRDVVVFQIRPSLCRAEPRLDPRWTGTFAHRSFSPDPQTTAPEQRSEPVRSA